MRTVTIVFAATLIVACSTKDKDSDQQLIRETKGLDQFDVPLGDPKPGDWLYEHKEPGQTFEVYKASVPVTPTGDRIKIYLLPVGEFAPIEDSIVHYTADYLNIYFGLDGRSGAIK